LLFPSLGGANNQGAIYGSYPGTPAVGIGLGTSAGSLAQVAAFTSTGLSITGGLTANNGTLTASAPVLDLAQTWNDAAVIFTGLKFNVTNTASNGNSLSLNLQTGGSSVFTVRRDGVTGASLFAVGTGWLGNTLYNGGVMLTSGSEVAWANNSTSVYNTLDVRLARDAADTLAQRRTTNAQTFNIYNTFTSATNHERGFLKWSSNVFQIGTEKGSAGGTARGLELRTDNTARITIGSAGELGFFGAVAAAQPTAVADATDAATVITQLNALLSRMRTLGLIAT
jgi:hypothetical protein